MGGMSEKLADTHRIQNFAPLENGRLTFLVFLSYYEISWSFIMYLTVS